MGKAHWPRWEVPRWLLRAKVYPGSKDPLGWGRPSKISSSAFLCSFSEAPGNTSSSRSFASWLLWWLLSLNFLSSGYIPWSQLLDLQLCSVVWRRFVIPVAQSFTLAWVGDLLLTNNLVRTSLPLMQLVYFSHSVMSDCLRPPWTAAFQGPLSITNSQSLPKLMSIKLVMPSNHLILCQPLLLLPSILSSIRVFSNESVLHIRWPKYWSFSFSISPSNSGLISFRMNWLDLLAVQGTLKSLLQRHSSKASPLWC